MLTVEKIEEQLESLPEGAVLSHVWMKKIGEPSEEGQKYELKLYFTKGDARITIPFKYTKPHIPKKDNEDLVGNKDSYYQKPRKVKLTEMFS